MVEIPPYKTMSIYRQLFIEYLFSWNNRINEKLDYLLNEELNEELIDLLIRKKTKTTYFKNINIENYDIILLKVEKNA